MRTFKRLLPCLMVLVLLAGVAPAQPAGVTRTSHNQWAVASKSQSTAGYNHTPDQLRLDFGTVVRDTADEQSFRPGPSDIPSVLQQQVSRGASPWNWFFTWSWFSLLIAR